MKKNKLLVVLLALTLLLSLASCGEKPAPGTADGPGSETDPPTPATEPTPEIEMPDGPGSVKPVPPRPEYCELQMEYTEDSEEIGTLTAYDAEGSELWQYVTEEFPCTELVQVQSVGPGKDGWLMLCGGELRCIADGEVLWRNGDFGGAGACWDFGPDGTLYLSGYYGPHLMAVDENGKTLGRWDTFDSETYWPFSVDLTEDGKADITFDGNHAVLRVDPKTGTYEQVGWDYSFEYENPVYVSTTEEFINAIDHGTAILMEPGVYNLTEYLENNYVPGYWGDDSLWQPTGALVDFRLDGPELVVCNINDLVIRSVDPDAPAEIVCEPRYADVLTFFNCDNLQLIDLVMGHTPEQGTCEGDVLMLKHCINATLQELDLYGCGAYALIAEDCGNIYTFLGKMHDCSYGIACLTDVGSAEFDNVAFCDCRQYTMFELFDSAAAFYDCSFERLEGNLISAYGDASAEFCYCSFDEAAENDLMHHPQLGGAITVEK